MSERLTVKEKKFVREVVQHGNATQAVVDAGYELKNRDVAKSTATKLMKKPKIQNAIAQLLDDMYPELEQKTAERLHDLIDSPISYGKGMPGISAGDLLKAIQYVHKLKGQAPVERKQHEHAHIHAKLGLPGEGE